MEYKLISPPFSLDFWNMSRSEANAYYNWYIEQIPSRIEILKQTIHSALDYDYQYWDADRTLDSLNVLGGWFAKNVSIQPMNETEKDEFYKNLSGWFKEVDKDDWILTSQSISLSIDIGMYLSEIFIDNYPQVGWEMITKKNDIDYQQPVLSGFGKMKFNPTRMATTLAYGYADNTYTSARLRELYEIWSDYASKNSITE